MSKAEDLSQNRYPTMAKKYAFIDGYEQAEKDLELTWEDVRRIYLIVNSTINDVDMDNLTDKSIYQEVLKRFKERKGE